MNTLVLQLMGCHFDNSEELEVAIQEWLHKKVLNLCHDGIFKLLPGFGIFRHAPLSLGNTFQDLPRLRETVDNTECYI
jgi:hypothetical protein